MYSNHAPLTNFLAWLTALGIQCWECNSAYDKRCGDDFDGYSVALVDCDQRQNLVQHLDHEFGEWVESGDATESAALCRKTTQTVEGETRVIRGCGWVKNFDSLRGRSCFNRAGTKEIQMFHCVCDTDSCNGAADVVANTVKVLLVAVAAFVFANNFAS